MWCDIGCCGVGVNIVCNRFGFWVFFFLWWNRCFDIWCDGLFDGWLEIWVVLLLESWVGFDLDCRLVGWWVVGCVILVCVVLLVGYSCFCCLIGRLVICCWGGLCYRFWWLCGFCVLDVCVVCEIWLRLVCCEIVGGFF